MILALRVLARGGPGSAAGLLPEVTVPHCARGRLTLFGFRFDDFEKRVGLRGGAEKGIFSAKRRWRARPKGYGKTEWRVRKSWRLLLLHRHLFVAHCFALCCSLVSQLVYREGLAGSRRYGSPLVGRWMHCVQNRLAALPRGTHIGIK